jgi:hypothetical protein
MAAVEIRISGLTPSTSEHVPGARFKHFATGGHLTVGHSEEIGGEIVEFLKRLTSADAGVAGSGIGVRRAIV